MRSDFFQRQIIAHRIEIPVDTLSLAGDIWLPEDPWGMIVFAHGSGSNRLSPRNRHVAQLFYEQGLGSCLFDLWALAELEQETDWVLAARRFAAVSDWLAIQLDRNLPFGFFGASSGAAVALIASTFGRTNARALVSRGGRPDLAGHYLQQVQVPCLLVVGSQDQSVLDLNRRSLEMIPNTSPKALHTIVGAGHLFEEAGQLEQVAVLSLDWYRDYLTPKN